MKSERISGQLHRHLIVCRKVQGRRIGGACSLNRHLVGLELDAIFFGIADDVAPDFVICLRSGQPDADGALRGHVEQIRDQRNRQSRMR